MPSRKKAAAKRLAKPRKVTFKEKPAMMSKEEWAIERARCTVVMMDRKRRRHTSQASQAVSMARAAQAQVCHLGGTH